MDRVTLLDKNRVFMTKYAAPSVLTGFFVAAVTGTDRQTAEAAFTDPGRILVENTESLFAPKIYDGYTKINEIREQEDGVIIILERG